MLEQRNIYKEFEQEFGARIEDSKEYKQYIKRSYDMWMSHHPVNSTTEVVQMKCIHLSIDNLKRLVGNQQLIEDLTADAEYGKKIVNMLREDERVRNDNPAVAKAYRNYITLLELARK